jgi:hypothetical protein
MPEMLGRDQDVAVGPAPALDLPAPELELSEDGGSAEGADGAVRFRLVAPPGTGRLRIFLEPRGAIDGVRIQGREVDWRDAGGSADDGPWVGHYAAPPAEGVEVEVQTSDPEALRVAAVAQQWELPGADRGGPGPRDASFMQAPWPWDSDTTMVRRQWAPADLSTSVAEGSEGSADSEDDSALAEPAEGAVQ